ncbi:2-oxoglutarate and iron-dependent oxygenase domain-containing protein [Leifsonia sp. F6_8S_P_1B]|uniref:2-oxoglutarate and iron-dependent oxygenase domain-containing protein n=1 Tax=Leifsonia williamsii TaxID=3035919 RepID=A0ABT8K6L7_9MICO|nr:2-oxoglutarate and iron-dependent oxygenase domain-containing protein [Leifsonia williamsii]MDN4612822.1 2-oxoglutarate and iron-dependent oxygenase domain-containing protein [Leifsonia williamsii]
MSLDSLPILDISELDQGEAAASEFRAKLRQVTHDVGFFYLVGHGIPQELIDEVLDVSWRFFALPEADKLAIENVHSPQFRGYTRTGEELTNGAVDWREQIDIGEERATVDGGPAFQRLEGPNLWPEALPELEAAITRWRQELSALALRLLRTWAVALGSPADVFDAAFADHPFSLIKIVRYPGTSDDVAQQGVGAHRDGGVLTLLLVEPGKGGLQVEHEGDWIDAPSIPGAFVVNIGEMLELATDGYLKATLHRVESPRIGTDRISIPFFFNPALDSTVPRLELPAELQAEARGLSSDPTNSPILETYGDNALRYRLRAHPNVAAIHHADLLSRPAAS